MTFKLFILKRFLIQFDKYNLKLDKYVCICMIFIIMLSQKIICNFNSSKVFVHVNISSVPTRVE